MEEVFETTTYPLETQERIFKWYKTRRISDEDPEVWLNYIQRQLEELERQFLLYLRNDETTWDPMVVDYFERQIKSLENTKNTNNSSGSEQSKNGGSVTQKHGGSDTTNETGENGNKRTLGTQHTEKRGDTWSGVDKVSGSGSSSGNSKQTNNLTDTRTDDLETLRTDDLENLRTDDLSNLRTDDLTGLQTDNLDNLQTLNTQLDTEGKTSGTQKTGVRALQGDLPMSSTYGNVQAPVIPENPTATQALVFADMPPTLDWDFTTSQQQSVTEAAADQNNTGLSKQTGTIDNKQTGTRENKQTGTQEQKQYGTVKTEQGGTVKTEQGGTVKHEQGGTIDVDNSAESSSEESTQYGRKIDIDITSGDSGTIDDAGSHSREVVTNYDREISTENNLESNVTKSSEASETGSRDGDVRERYSGRHEAAPELLQKAQNYILRSNAMKWLRKKLDEVFMQVLDIM